MIKNIGFGLTLLFCAGAVISCDKIASPSPTQETINSTLVNKALSDLVSEQLVMGASGLIYKDGKEIFYGDAGLADKEKEQKWQRDTLASIYSMTKPITGVTLMSLYEEGLFDLEDPLDKYLPEYANVKVFTGIASDGNPILEAPTRPIKVIDIFRHTACFGYGWGSGPVSTLFNAADVMNPQKPLAQFSQELADIPLYCQPGTQWKYSVSVDVQARLAEVITGRAFEDLVKERVLEPLKMSNTGYFVPEDQKSRLAAVYLRDEAGTLKRSPDRNIYSFQNEKPLQINGGSGLISTIDDYMRFALMLQNEGTFEGVQILKPETIALMSRDHLPSNLMTKDFLPSKGQMGFGLNFAVRLAAPINDSEPYGTVGEFFWDGAASTLFWVDPKNDVTAVFFIQVMPFNQDAQAKFRRAVYEALDLIETP